MLRIDKELEVRYRNLFLSVCDELAQKIPEKESLFRAMQREANEYLNFPIVDNLCYLVIEYFDELDRDTIEVFVRLRA